MAMGNAMLILGTALKKECELLESDWDDKDIIFYTERYKKTAVFKYHMHIPLIFFIAPKDIKAEDRKS